MSQSVSRASRITVPEPSKVALRNVRRLEREPASYIRIRVGFRRSS